MKTSRKTLTKIPFRIPKNRPDTEQEDKLYSILCDINSTFPLDDISYSFEEKCFSIGKNGRRIQLYVVDDIDMDKIRKNEYGFYCLVPKHKLSTTDEYSQIETDVHLSNTIYRALDPVGYKKMMGKYERQDKERLKLNRD